MNAAVRARFSAAVRYDVGFSWAAVCGGTVMSLLACIAARSVGESAIAEASAVRDLSVICPREAEPTELRSTWRGSREVGQKTGAIRRNRRQS